jgi:hypothetical protein
VNIEERKECQNGTSLDQLPEQSLSKKFWAENEIHEGISRQQERRLLKPEEIASAFVVPIRLIRDGKMFLLLNICVLWKNPQGKFFTYFSTKLGFLCILFTTVLFVAPRRNICISQNCIQLYSVSESIYSLKSYFHEQWQKVHISWAPRINIFWSFNFADSSGFFLISEKPIYFET